jgi:hypothetical protein
MGHIVKPVEPVDPPLTAAGVWEMQLASAIESILSDPIVGRRRDILE